MTSDTATAGQIRETAAVIGKLRPDYSPMIEFYSRIFAAQADALTGISPDPIQIGADLLALKKENEMPLISPIQFSVDETAARDLMKTMAELATGHAPRLAKAGRTLLGTLDTLDLSGLFEALLDSRSIEDMAQAVGLTPEELGFFGYNAMFPSLQAGAVQLAAYLDPKAVHNKSYCPICGSTPDFAFLDETGAKQVTCSLCSHSWKVSRMGCLFCDNDKPKNQHYFFSEEEKEYRVYYCDTCKNYLKTVDTREMGRRFVPRLEQIATLHLDLKAQEQGFTRAQDSLT